MTAPAPPTISDIEPPFGGAADDGNAKLIGCQISQV